MKKILLAICLCVSTLLNAAVIETPNLNVKMEVEGDIKADGETVWYLVFHETQSEGQTYTAFQMELTLPEGVSVNKVKSGRVMVADATLNAIRFDGLGHSLALGEKNPLVIGCTTMATEKDKLDWFNDDEDGNIISELFKIGFVASPEASFKDFKIVADNVKFILDDASAHKPAQEVSVTVSVTGVNNANADEASVKAQKFMTKKGLVITKGNKKYNAAAQEVE